MNACEMICDILAPLELPIAENSYNGKDMEYIIFNVFSEHTALSADDESIDETSDCYIHYFTKDYKHGNKTKIKKLLKDNDVGIIDTEILYEKDTGYTHVVFQVELLGYEDYETED